MIRPSVYWPLLIFLRIRFRLGSQWMLAGYDSVGTRTYFARFIWTGAPKDKKERSFERDYFSPSIWKETT